MVIWTQGPWSDSRSYGGHLAVMVACVVVLEGLICAQAAVEAGSRRIEVIYVADGCLLGGSDRCCARRVAAGTR